MLTPPSWNLFHLSKAVVKLFELATNEPLFPVGSFGLTAEQIDQEYIPCRSIFLIKTFKCTSASWSTWWTGYHLTCALRIFSISHRSFCWCCRKTLEGECQPVLNQPFLTEGPEGWGACQMSNIMYFHKPQPMYIHRYSLLDLSVVTCDIPPSPGSRIGPVHSSLSWNMRILKTNCTIM